MARRPRLSPHDLQRVLVAAEMWEQSLLDAGAGYNTEEGRLEMVMFMQRIQKFRREFFGRTKGERDFAEGRMLTLQEIASLERVPEVK